MDGTATRLAWYEITRHGQYAGDLLASFELFLVRDYELFFKNDSFPHRNDTCMLHVNGTHADIVHTCICKVDAHIIQFLVSINTSCA